MQQPRVSHAGPERFVLALALLVPLGLMAFTLAQLPSVSRDLPSSAFDAGTSERLVTHRPARSTAPPPTLAAPTPTVAATVAPTAARSAAPSPTADAARTYTVRRGDELKQIAARYGVSIWSVIAANDIPNPDSLRVGQVLDIPDH